MPVVLNRESKQIRAKLLLPRRDRQSIETDDAARSVRTAGSSAACPAAMALIHRPVGLIDACPAALRNG